MAVLVQNIDTVFINAVIYVSYGKTCESTYYLENLESCTFHFSFIYLSYMYTLKEKQKTRFILSTKLGLDYLKHVSRVT